MLLCRTLDYATCPFEHADCPTRMQVCAAACQLDPDNEE